MVQAFLTMGIIISLPLILLVSTYQLKTVMTVTFALFTLHMLTFWWELARWVDSSMLDSLYNQVLSWAGYSVGSIADGMLGKGAAQAQDAGARGAGALMSAGKALRKG